MTPQGERVRFVDGVLQLSASDLTHFLACPHRTALDLAAAHGTRIAPHWHDPVLEVLQERGLEHERAYADQLRASGLRIADLGDLQGEDAVATTIVAMRDGVDVLLQPQLRTAAWMGRPDVLRRVEIPSDLGAWSYEVVDTKLSRETKAGTILQLSLYTELLAEAQGSVAEHFHVVTPAGTETYRVDDFAAYVRLVRRQLADAVAADPSALLSATYPEPVEHCAVCRWQFECRDRRRKDDHLSLVAGISRLQRKELVGAGVDTLTQLGTLPLPLPFVPRRGSPDTFVRVREQARLQRASQEQGRLVYELLPLQVDQGLARLPLPSPGDVFLDLEGDAFSREGGREYLFGLVVVGEAGDGISRSWWASTDAEERSVFERVVDELVTLRGRFPGMHVYHYAPYEPAALKRLMGRHATREAEIDELLRAELFVDLFSVVRQAVRVGAESYSIKSLEPLYGFDRSVSLETAGKARRVVERSLGLGLPELVTYDVRQTVEVYNRDDCLSAWRLRDWLEDRRRDLEAAGASIPRPLPRDGSAPLALAQQSERVQTLMGQLTTLQEGGEVASAARRLLGHLLDWHRREDKVAWWDYFRLAALTDEELLDERSGLSGLRLVERIHNNPRGGVVDRYTWPPQEFDVRRGSSLRRVGGDRFGTVHDIDRAARTIDVKKSRKKSDLHPTAVFVYKLVPSTVQAEALLRIAEDTIDQGLAATRYAAASDLLRGHPPRLTKRSLDALAGESNIERAVRIVKDLDRSVLAVQGPPGTGKTHIGAHMIVALAAAGRRVGVAAMGHHAIDNLLREVGRVAAAAQERVRCLHKVSELGLLGSPVEETDDNDVAIASLGDAQGAVVGGTVWLWARPDASDVLDVLFVDEAGQMALADVIAASQAARSVVLLGDPRQLDQPQQGSHPDGAEASALEHLLGRHQTIPPDLGLFLPETWRLAPRVCDFTSEVFYERRLSARPGLEQQRLLVAPPFDGAGLWVVPVPHEGNQHSSPEEVEAIARIVDRLVARGSTWVDSSGQCHPLRETDLLVVSPYNAQVGLLLERLAGRGVRVGTVDKFQGQEAPVVLYSMAASTTEDAPRGMDFLFSPNRLNVASSRARCACILVASPRLFAPECRTPRQMQLANALCRYVELARAVAYAPA